MNDECGPTAYCAKDGCGGEGSCAPRPQSCEEGEEPVCGCDGITYFTPCLATANGQNIGSDAPCGATALACSRGDKTCAIRKGGFCAVFIDSKDQCPADTNAPVKGSCWVVPESCPQFNVHFDSCDGKDKCVHTCDVVKKERPFYFQPDCH